MNSYQDFKIFYSSNIILFIVILFVIIYIIINWDIVYSGNYLSGEIVKPILISGILFLIFHMILTWDDNNDEQSNGNELILPKYKLGEGENQAKNEILAANVEVPTNMQNQNQNSNLNLNTQLNNKYKILNKFDIPHPNYNNLINSYNKQNNMGNPTLEQFGKMGQNLSNNSDNNNGNKLSNQNIFVSHKNSSKYGIKFV
jgi:hypothetical protein